jgi:S1-C subfamily serine protease
MPDSAKPISRGVFSGEAIRRHPMTDPTAFATYSMPTVQGMSGSPIMDSQGRVIGIVSAVHSDWHMVSFSPTLDQIKWAIDETIED